jgi:hypothetical protein
MPEAGFEAAIQVTSARAHNSDLVANKSAYYLNTARRKGEKGALGSVYMCTWV